MQTGCECSVLRNNHDMLEEVAYACDAIIISPGPQTPEKAGSLLGFLASFIEKKPILGICLGHQAIGVSLGAALNKASQPKHGKVETISHTGGALFNDISGHFLATRYHSLILNGIPDTLEVTARSETGEIMGIKHRQYPVWGVQFHPESCMTPHGLTLIRNFLNMVNPL